MTTAVMEKPKTEKPPTKIKFRLLRARHIENVYETNDKGWYILNANGKRIKKGTTAYQVERDPVTGGPKQPIFESEKELDKLFNAQGFAPKFERISEPTLVMIDPLERRQGETIQSFLARLADMQEQIKGEIDNKIKQVDNMDKDELTSFAEDNEIDVSKAKDIVQLRNTIKAALKG